MHDEPTKRCGKPLKHAPWRRRLRRGSASANIILTTPYYGYVSRGSGGKKLKEGKDKKRKSSFPLPSTSS
jgi:hypothetical protein